MISNELTAPVYMIGSVAVLLFIAGIIRATVKPVKKTLFSASIIAGILGFILMSVNSKLSFMPISNSNFEQLTIHLVSLNFMAIIFLGIGQSKAAKKEQKSKRGGLLLSLLLNGIICVQAAVGGLIALAASKTTNPDFDILSGAIAANGLGGSPSSALAAANLWRGISSPHIVEFAMLYGSVGFLVASLVGIPLIKVFIKRNMTTKREVQANDAFYNGHYPAEASAAYGQQKLHRSNIDQFVFQLAFLFTSYAAVYLTVTGLINKFVTSEGTANTIYTVMFLFCVFGAILIKVLVELCHLDRFFDREVQSGITSLITDSLLVCCMMAVSISVVTQYFIPLAATILVLTALTAGIAWLILKNTGPGRVERFLYIFGACTGTAASGQTLMKIVDPEFTTVGDEIVWSNVLGTFTSVTTTLAAFVPLIGSMVYLGINAVSAVVLLALAAAVTLSMKPRKKDRA